MAQLNYSLPILNTSAETEDPKVRTALSDIQTWANGANVGTDNLTNNAVTLAKIASGATSRLLGFVHLNQSFNIGANGSAGIGPGGGGVNVTHDGKAGTAILVHSVVRGSHATDAGVSWRLYRGGVEQASYGLTLGQMGGPWTATGVILHNFAALSGVHSWSATVDLGNNPTEIRNAGAGFIVIFSNA